MPCKPLSWMPCVAVMLGTVLTLPHNASAQVPAPVSESAFAQANPAHCPKEADARLGTPDFYAFPSAQLAGPVGSVIRCWEVVLPAGLAGRYIGYRLMYITSTRVTQNGYTLDITVPATGLAYVPRALTVAGPRPVLVNPHGTSAIARPPAGPLTCIPSRSLGMDGVLTQLDAEVPNAVLAAPDFIGLGVDAVLRPPQSDMALPNGVRPFSNISYPFLSLEGHGRATIDLVRAVRSLPGAQTGYRPKWAAIGQSAGGHGALAAAEIRRKHGYGSELNLVGVVAGAPTSELTDTSSTTAIQRVVVPMVLAGLSLEWRDIRPAELIIPQAQQKFAETANQGCLSNQSIWEWTQAFNGLPADVTIPGTGNNLIVQAALIANSPGHQPTDVPLLIGLVSGDPVVTRGRTDKFVTRMRGQLAGVPATNPGRVTYCVVSGSPSFYHWALRLPDHAEVLNRMFNQSTTCTDPSLRPVTLSARSFLRTLFAAPQ